MKPTKKQNVKSQSRKTGIEEKSQIHDTSGGEMPDPDYRQSSKVRKDAEAAFRQSGK